jgi:RNA polymerase sigma factor FliA
MSWVSVLRSESQLSFDLQKSCTDQNEPDFSGISSHIDEQRDLLLLRHLPQVRFIARRIHCRLPRQVLLDDLVHAGVLGLMDAVEKYDPAKKVQLKHYAEFRIRGAILDSLRQVDWSPRTLRSQARRLDKTITESRARLGREPTEPEIAAALDMTLTRLQHLRNDLRGLDVTSAHAEADRISGDNKAPGSATREDQDPYHQTLRSEMQGLLSGAVDQLPLREQEVLALYDFDELSMKEVAKTMGIGESRVSQIHSSAMLHLRARLFKRLRRTPPAMEISIISASVASKNPRKSLLRCGKNAAPSIQKLAG